jgi:hypothetical protein
MQAFVARDNVHAAQYAAQARAAGDQIADDEDRQQVLADVATLLRA